MKRTNKLVALFAVLAFAMMTIMPVAALATDTPGTWQTGADASTPPASPTPGNIDAQIGGTAALSMPTKATVNGEEVDITGTVAWKKGDVFNTATAVSGTTVNVDTASATYWATTSVSVDDDDNDETPDVTKYLFGKITVTGTKAAAPEIAMKDASGAAATAAKIMSPVTLSLPTITGVTNTNAKVVWTIGSTSITSENAAENDAELSGNDLILTPASSGTIAVKAEWVLPGDSTNVSLQTAASEKSVTVEMFSKPSPSPAATSVPVGTLVTLTAVAPSGLPDDAFVVWGDGETTINDSPAMPDSPPSGVKAITKNTIQYAPQATVPANFEAIWAVPVPSADEGVGSRTIASAPAGTIAISPTADPGSAAVTGTPLTLTVATEAPALPNEKTTLIATLDPDTSANLDDFEITWTGGDVEPIQGEPLKAQVTTPGEGGSPTTVTATAKNNDAAISDEATVNVSPGSPDYGNLEITGSNTQVKPGGTLTLTVSNTGSNALPSTTTFTWTPTGGAAVSPNGTAEAKTTTLTAPTTPGPYTVQVNSSNGLPAATFTYEVTDTPAEPSATAAPAEPGTSAEPSTPASPSQPTSGSDYPSAAPGGTTTTPSSAPTSAPSSGASSEPSSSASSEPSGSASGEPSGDTSAAPSTEPSGDTSAAPSAEPNTPADEVPIEPAEDAPVDFEISENPDGSGSVLTGIDVATDNDQVAANAVENLYDSIQVPEGQTVEVLNADGEPAEMGDPVATGMIVCVLSTDGTVVSRTAVVVKGDVMGTGEMNLTQLVRLAAAFQGTEPLTGAYLMAGDLAGDDGQITLTDLVRMAALYKTSQE